MAEDGTDGAEEAEEADGAGDAMFESLFALDLREARRRLLDAFDRAYLQRVLERVHGNVAAAARAADVDRGTLFRMLRRLGLRVERRGATFVSYDGDSSLAPAPSSYRDAGPTLRPEDK